MSKRPNCPLCHFPEKTCICHAISTITSKHRIIILQHPSEIKQAKGTAKLVKLCLEECVIIHGESESDFADIKQALNDDCRKTYLLYPAKESRPVEQLTKEFPPANLIFVDGSWKKAYKILQLNPWLLSLPTLSFESAPETAYKIRKAPRTDSLSTLEAVARTLEFIDEIDTTPLYKAFEAMIDGQWRFMSEDVKSRY